MSIAANVTLQTTGFERLPDLLDIEFMSRRLAPLLQPGDLHLASAEVVGCAPGKRAVVAYHTLRHGGPGPVLIGKAFTDRMRARRLHSMLEQLGALEAADDRFGVPRPLACLAELGVSVQMAAAGQSLDRVQGSERRAGVVAAARWLATLHRSTVNLERQLDLAAEMRKLTSWAELVGRRAPKVAATTAHLLARLRRLADHLEIATSVPIHKDFHYQHVLVDDGRVMVIDLDEMRSGDPAFDVAHFGANLRLLGIREETSSNESARLESAFLDAYADQTGYETDTRHSFFWAYTTIKIAKQLAGGRGPTPVPSGAELDRQIGLIVEEGMRCPLR